jgi:hypothetical protein
VEFPGVPLKEEEEDFDVVTKEASPEFEDLMVAVLENAGINREDCLGADQVATNPVAAVATMYLAYPAMPG